MTEKEIKIRTLDHHMIHGVLTRAKSCQSLIIFVHGLAGHKNEHLFYNAARFFPPKGFSTFRFDLYGYGKGARKLRDCTIRTHGQDINRVVKHFAKKFKKIYLVGHSLGGPSILFSDTSAASSIVLWDPTFDFDFYADFNPTKQGYYLIDGGVEEVIGKKMVAEGKRVQNVVKEAQNCFVPLKIICAGKGVLITPWKKNFNKLNKPKQLVSIKGARHCFDEEGTEEKLFKETLSWIRK